jgi:hypothetical protein
LNRPSSGQVSLQSYLKFGGLPYLRHLPLDDAVIFHYLRNVTDAILLKDIVSRYDIRNVSFLQLLTRFLADNVGSLVTARKISEYLKAQKIKISHNLVIDYLSYLSNALLILPARRCDKVRDREFGNLLAIPDNFPKKVVSLDAVAGGSHKGIDHIHLEDFLLSM